MQKKLESVLSSVILFILLALWVALILRQANPLTTYPNLDGGYYLYIGQQIVNGKLPYLDVWESKPPGIFYVNALGLFIGRGTRWGLWALEFSFLFLSSWLGLGVMRKRYGLAPALFGTAAWLWGMNSVLSGGNLTEEYALVFSFLSLASFLRADETEKYPFFDFLIGASFACSFLFRANNTGMQISIVLVWLLTAINHRDGFTLLKRLSWSGLGVVTVLGAVAAYFGWKGILGEAVNAAIVYNFSVTSGHTDILSSLMQGIVFIGIPSGFAFLGYFALANQSLEKRHIDAFGLLLLINFPLEIILSGLAGRNYAHYFISWLPVLGLLSAWLFKLVIGWFSEVVERFRFVLFAALLMVCAFSFQSELLEYRDSFSRLLVERGRGVELDHPVARYIRDNTSPGDKVLIWGSELGLDFMARREEPTAYIFYPLYMDSPLSARMASQFYQDLIREKPTLIVDSQPSNPDLLPALDQQVRREQAQAAKLWPYLPENILDVYAFVQSNYHLETSVAGYRVYRLNDTK